MNRHILICMLVFGVLSIAGQQKKQTTGNEIPANCEYAQRILSTINGLRVSDNIIIISRLGRGESSKSLSRNRLKKVKDYLETAWKRSPETIIMATGEEVEGLGRLEFYVAGIFVDALFAEKNKVIPTFCKNQE